MILNANSVTCLEKKCDIGRYCVYECRQKRFGDNQSLSSIASLLCAIARSIVSHLPRTVSYPDPKNYPKNVCAYFIYSNPNRRLILISNKMNHNFLAIFRAFSRRREYFLIRSIIDNVMMSLLIFLYQPRSS